jgi:hypothetical protein
LRAQVVVELPMGHFHYLAQAAGVLVDLKHLLLVKHLVILLQLLWVVEVLVAPMELIQFAML